MSQLTVSERHPDSHYFAQAVDERIIQNIAPQASPKMRATKIALRVLAIPVAFVGRIPLFPFATALANGNTAYKVVLIIGEGGAFTGTGAWSVFQMTERECIPLTDTEKKLFGIKPIGCKHITMLTTSVALGALTAVPIAYIAYIGPTLQGSSLGWAIATEASEALLAIYAWQRNLLDLSLPPLNNEKRTAHFALCDAKAKLLDMIHRQKFHLLHATPEQIATYQEGFPTETIVAEMHDRVQSLFEHILEKNKALPQPATTTLSKCTTIAKKTAVVSLTLFAWAPNVYFTWFQAKGATKLLYDEEWFGNASGTFIASAVAYVTASGVYHSSRRLVNFVHQISTSQKTDNPNMKVRPITTALVNTLAAVIGALAHGTVVQVTNQEFDNPTRTFLQYSLITGTILFVTNAINDLIPTPEINTLYTQLTTLQNLLTNTQDPYLAAYLDTLPPDIRTQLTTASLTHLLPPIHTDTIPLTAIPNTP